MFKRLTDEQRDLANKNIGLIAVIVRKFSNHPGVQVADLWQEGAIGLCIAASKFDPDRGFQFSTYATHWISNHIRRAVFESKSTMHIPELNHVIRAHVQRIDARDCAKTGTIRPPEEVAAEINMWQEVMPRHVEKARASRYEFSEVTAPDGEREDVLNLLASDSDTEGDVAKKEITAVAGKVLAKTNPKYSRAFRYYFVDDETLADTGRRIGKTRERVRQINEQIIGRIQKAIEE